MRLAAVRAHAPGDPRQSGTRVSLLTRRPRCASVHVGAAGGARGMRVGVGPGDAAREFPRDPDHLGAASSDAPAVVTQHPHEAVHADAHDIAVDTPLAEAQAEVGDSTGRAPLPTLGRSPFDDCAAPCEANDANRAGDGAQSAALGVAVDAADAGDRQGTYAPCTEVRTLQKGEHKGRWGWRRLLRWRSNGCASADADSHAPKHARGATLDEHGRTHSPAHLLLSAEAAPSWMVRGHILEGYFVPKDGLTHWYARAPLPRAQSSFYPQPQPAPVHARTRSRRLGWACEGRTYRRPCTHARARAPQGQIPRLPALALSSSQRDGQCVDDGRAGDYRSLPVARG